MDENQKKGPNAPDEAVNHLEQVIPVNSARLELIKVNSVNGKTYVSGGPPGRITIRTINTGSFNYTPAVEFKNEGATVEISAVPSNGSDWMVKVLKGFHVTDLPKDWTDPDAGWKMDVAGWPDPDEENLSNEERQHRREERQHQREERQHQREERQRQREERQRVRFETRESIRQANDFARQNRNFWSSLEEGLEPLGEIFNNFGRSLSQALSGPDDLYIEIPANVELQAKSVSGSLSIANMTGYCVIKNTSGALSLNRLSGGMRVKGVSGKVEGRDLGGRAEIKVTTGSVELTNSRLTGLDLSVTSGRILVETALAGPPDGDYKINTSNGAVKLLLPQDSQASIDCRTLNGRLSMPKISSVEIRNRPGQSQSRIELNGGGRRVSVNTLNGNLELALYDQPGEYAGQMQNHGSWPVPPIPPVPPVPPVPPIWTAGPDSGVQSPAPAPQYAPPSYAQTPGWPSDVVNHNSEPLITPVPQNSDSSNNVTPENPAPVKEPAQSPAGPAADNDKRTRQLDILQAIERGEISVDEGMRRLGDIES